MTDSTENISRNGTALRVSVALLDRLMNLAGELVLSRNQLLQGISSTSFKDIEVSGQRIDLITSELQEAIMQTRMQPVGSLLESISKAADDFCKECGKRVDLKIEGKDVELDKTILESIEAPLKTIVENRIEHGIESPGERRKNGKEPSAVLLLKAFHDAGQINILVSDDGSGSDAGAALDSVAMSIESLGGICEAEASPGQGTNVLIKLPLTLAIIPCQITTVGNERYAVPQTNLSELLRIPGSEVREKIERVGDAEVVRLRGELLPLLNLPDILSSEKAYLDPETGTEKPDRRRNLADRRSREYKETDSGILMEKARPGKGWQKRTEPERRRQPESAVHIAVVFAGAYKYGLVVDQLHDSEEIVVKPLGRHLKQCESYAGATIMGDGRVALILDVLSLAQTAGLSTRAEAEQLTKTDRKAEERNRNMSSLIVFKNRETEYFAAPLEFVDRIERLPSSGIEQIGERKVAQYRGGVLSLYELSQIAGVGPLPERDHHEVIVFKINDLEFGLMATPPVDTIKVVLKIDDSTLKQPGIIGSMTISGRTTLILDLFELEKQLNRS